LIFLAESQLFMRVLLSVRTLNPLFLYPLCCLLLAICILRSSIAFKERKMPEAKCQKPEAKN